MKSILIKIGIIAGLLSMLAHPVHADLSNSLKVCDHNANPDKCGEAVFSWDPDLVVTNGASSWSIPFTINVVPDPTVQSSTLSISVGTSSPAFPPPPTASGIQNILTAVFVNNANSSTVENLNNIDYNLNAPFQFPLAPIPKGSYTLTLTIQTWKGTVSTSTTFSF